MLTLNVSKIADKLLSCLNLSLPVLLWPLFGIYEKICLKLEEKYRIANENAVTCDRKEMGLKREVFKNLQVHLRMGAGYFNKTIMHAIVEYHQKKQRFE